MQVSLPGALSGDSIDVNLLQGQKIDQMNQANAVATSIANSTGGSLASGAVSAQPVASVTTADDVKTANVASSVATMVNLSSSSSVYSNAVSVNISAELAQADVTSVSKQQIIEPTAELESISTYVAKEGDNAETIAQEYGVSSQTIRWANDLKDNSIAVGASITVPVVDGVVYTVKDGDTLASIASKYQSDIDEIVNINNLDDEQVDVGAVLLLPDGILPETERPEYVPPVQTTTPSYNYTYSSSGTKTPG